MQLRKLFLVGAVALPSLILIAAQRPPRALRASSVTISGSFSTKAPPAWAREDPADSLYRAARRALNDEDYRVAARLFASITDKYPRSTYAAEALYYRAFALYRSGRETDLRDALTSLDAHKRRFPKGGLADDVDQLSIRINGELAKRGDSKSAEKVTRAAADTTAPCTSGDDRDDIRLAAMDALLQMNTENALPIIKQVLQKRDACSAKLRERAMFLLSQKRGSESEALLIDAISNDPSRNVRDQAIFWLGETSSERGATVLENLATSSPDAGVREKALFALSQQHRNRASALMRRFAESSETPRRLRENAVFQIGQIRSSENAQYLKDLFTKLARSEEDLRKAILFSLSQMKGFGNDRWLIAVALDEAQSAEVRKHALFSAGQSGVSGSDLVSLYDRITDRAVKEQLIWVMSDSRDPSALDRLLQIAKSDKDPAMRKTAMFWLAQKNDPRIKALLLDILKD